MGFIFTLLAIPLMAVTLLGCYHGQIAFFTLRDVKAMDELTWDYMTDFNDKSHPVKAFQCCCGSESCRDKKTKGSQGKSIERRKVVPAKKQPGPHFNPLNRVHGPPNEEERHAGDLGVAEISINDKQIPLSGQYSILGRAVVVHADPDDLGKGEHKLSKSTGNAGSRVGCGIIGLQSSADPKL